MDIIAQFAPFILLHVVFLLFIGRRIAMMKEVSRRVEWKREEELSRMTPAERLRSVTGRFTWTMRMAAQRLATFNTVVLGLVVWFFFFSPLPAGGDMHVFFVLMMLVVSLATRQGTLRGPAAQEARAYKVFEWGYAGRWLDLGFGTVVAGAAALTFQKHMSPLLSGVYLGAAGVVTAMLLRWAILGHKPWNPRARKVDPVQERTS